MNLKEAIAAAARSAPVPKEIKSLGLTIELNKLPAGVVDDLQSNMMGANGRIDVSKLKEYRALAIHHSISDENGKPMFTIEEIKAWDNAVVFELMTEINGLNKIDKESQLDLGNVS
jgi:hypothetical protein